MGRKNTLWTTIGILGFFVLIFDSKKATVAAQEGIKLCLQVVIPSLFPYFIFSNILVSVIRGSWAIPVIGFLGGYPAGAQAVYSSYQSGRITKKDATDLLCYCNNAGPAFIFGMLSQLFQHWYIPWIIWCVHIFSALLVKVLFVRNTAQITQQPISKPSIPEIVTKAINGITIVCSWVILFKIIIKILSDRLLYQLSPTLRLIISGILELTNGCCGLQSIPSPAFRFILSTAFISFGGFCVTMQTASVVKELGVTKYIPCKLFQSVIAILLTWIISLVIF